MRKRAALARALALDPELLLLDEPTAGLDPLSASGIDELVQQLRDALGLTIMMVTHDLDQLWRAADTVAVLRVQGLTGIAYVELSGGSQNSPELQARPGEAYPVIRSGPSLMVRLDSSITTLLTNLNRTSERLNALLDDDTRREFKQTLADLRVVSRTLAARSSTIDSSLANAARTLDNSARFSGDLPRLLERIQKSADGFDRMTREIASAGSGANATLAGARADLQQATAETLPDVRQLVVELRELTGSLRRFSGQLEQNPSLLLFGKPAPERGPGE